MVSEQEAQVVVVVVVQSLWMCVQHAQGLFACTGIITQAAAIMRVGTKAHTWWVAAGKGGSCSVPDMAPQKMARRRP